MSTLERALEIAAKAHAGQVDKQNNPYILHPIRIMLRMHTDEERIVAILHDTVEDTADKPESERVTFDSLRAAGFPEKIVAAVDSVTRRKGEQYLSGLIERAKLDPIGIEVKLGDLADNTDPSRPNPVDRWASLLKKYEKAKDRLLAWKEIARKERELKRLKEAEP